MGTGTKRFGGVGGECETGETGAGYRRRLGKTLNMHGVNQDTAKEVSV